MRHEAHGDTLLFFVVFVNAVRRSWLKPLQLQEVRRPVRQIRRNADDHDH